MDETVCVILLLTGLCAPSASSSDTFYFIKDKMSWFAAQLYCSIEHTELAQILSVENVTALMNIPTDGYTERAWIGLYQNHTLWFWLSDAAAIYSMWYPGEPNNANASEYCASLTSDGFWYDQNCSLKKYGVCLKVEDNKYRTYIFTDEEVTWSDAKTYCEDNMAVLASIPSPTTNSIITSEMDRKPVSEVWIGLTRPQYWYWSVTRLRYHFRNWHPGQPDNLQGEENCAAVVANNGTWKDEDCETEYPFYCQGAIKTWKTVVRMKIHSSANVADSVIQANLLEQLHAELVDHGVTDFKLSWREVRRKK